MIKSKKFRRINVDGEIYGWIVKESKGFIIVCIEPYCDEGSRLEVYVASDIGSFWIDFPDVKGYNLRIVKPKDIRMIILKAIWNGWDPKSKSDNRTYDLIGEELIKK